MRTEYVTKKEFMAWLTGYKGPAFDMANCHKPKDGHCGCPMVEYVFEQCPNATEVLAGSVFATAFSAAGKAFRRFAFSKQILNALTLHWGSDDMDDPVSAATLVADFEREVARLRQQAP